MASLDARLRRLITAAATLAKRNPKIAAAIVTAIFAMAGLGFTVTVADVDGNGSIDRITLERKLKQVKAALAAPKGDLQASPSDTATKAIKPASSELRDETPADVFVGAITAGKEETEKAAEQLQPEPVGGAQNYSCRQDFGSHVYSSRNGAKPTLWVNHYTVSPNVKGRADVDAIVQYFERTRIASATYVVDFEGNCTQMVPLSQKPWTQGTANPYAISVEIIATGRETKQQWLNSPLVKKRILSSIARDSMRRYGIPRRKVNPVGCSFTPAGWTDHNALECGNNHTDVAPNFPYAEFARQLNDTVTSTDKSTCRKINSWRKAGKPYGGAFYRNTLLRVKALASRDVKCLSAGPVKS